MKKKVICLSIIAGLFLSVGLGVSKETVKFKYDTKQNINSNLLLSENGSIIIEPKVFKPVTV